MGEKYEVMEWRNDITSGEGYKWTQEYYGQSLIKALITCYRLKRSGAGCAKLIMR